MTATETTEAVVTLTIPTDRLDAFAAILEVGALVFSSKTTPYEVAVNLLGQLGRSCPRGHDDEPRARRRSP